MTVYSHGYRRREAGQLVFAARRAQPASGLYWKPFAAWAIGSEVALATHLYAPQLSDAVVAMIVGGLAFTVLTYPGKDRAPYSEVKQPALSGEAV